MKADLHRYLRVAREAVLWKLDGLSEYDVRRPLVPSGTNLLGLVKHLAAVDAGYFGETFGRPFPGPVPRWDDDEFNAGMYATADESRQGIEDLYRQVWAHSDATIEALPLDALGRVPWWPAESREVPLSRILIHMIAETNRHAGHADLVRELIDGATGMRADSAGLDDADAAQWSEYHDRLERIAREAAT